MTLFQIWSEGYAVTGNSSDAKHWGEQEADTFDDACDKFFRREEMYDPVKYYSHAIGEKPNYWGCRLYDNEADARKGFG